MGFEFTYSVPYWSNTYCSVPVPALAGKHEKVHVENVFVIHHHGNKYNTLNREKNRWLMILILPILKQINIRLRILHDSNMHNKTQVSGRYHHQDIWTKMSR